jgi:chromate transporter
MPAKTESARDHHLPRIPFKAACLYWLKLGFISFGGPAGQIAIMHQDLVDKKQWLSEPRFLHALNFCMLLPGPEAQQLATYIGWLMHKTLGGLIAGLFFILPSFFMLCILAYITLMYGNVPAVAGALAGIKPAVVAIVLMAVYRIGLRTLKNPLLWAIALLSFIGIYFLKLPFPLIILFSAFLGMVGSKRKPEYFQANNAHSTNTTTQQKAQTNHQPQAQVHTLFTWRNTFRVLSLGLSLWSLAFVFLIFTFGWQGAFTQMGWFFTKAALFTFGGAYAVLPYVYQGAVEHYQWLTTSQMMNGLALGETTPGPLIMVVTFVGFVAGWTQQVFGSSGLAPLFSAITAASIVTFFTFLPSFMFVLIGGPMIESTHNQLKFTAPLTAITAAVVGVILNLAVFFGRHVLWGESLNSAFNWQAFGLILIASGLLYRLNINVVLLIVIFGLIGVMKTLI